MNYNYINIVWIERGIILNIIEYIIDSYGLFINKNIIVEDKRYRRILKNIFPRLSFSKYEEHKSNNFYFNIRRIIKNQDVVIDYINNYDKYIYGENIELIPYYDINDMIIIYNVSSMKSGAQYYKNLFFNFTMKNRGNYHFGSWDHYREKQILMKYQKKFKVQWNQVFYLINRQFKKYNNPQYINIIPTIQHSQNEKKPSSQNEKYLEKILEKINKINKII